MRRPPGPETPPRMTAGSGGCSAGKAKPGAQAQKPEAGACEHCSPSLEAPRVGLSPVSRGGQTGPLPRTQGPC